MYKLGVVFTHNGRVFTYKVGNKPFLSNLFDNVVDKTVQKVIMNMIQLLKL